METHQITCDHCKRDLTYTTNCEDYRLTLRAESIPPHPDATSVTSMMIDPPIRRTMHFCNMKCLLSNFAEAARYHGFA